MCRKSYYHHHKSKHHPKYGHWLAGGMDKWAQEKRRRRRGRFYPPVNVKEKDDSYELYLYAPGLSKEDFDISLKDNFLKISVKEIDDKIVEEGGFWKRKEFSLGGFERHFELNEKIDLDSIKASYENGVLKLELGKLDGEETVRKDIFVA